MTSSRLAFLLNRHFASLADENEAAELRALVRKGSHDEELREMIEKYLDTEAGATDMSPGDANEILQNILMDSQAVKEIKVVPLWKTVVKYAAAAMIVIGLTVSGWWAVNKTTIFDTNDDVLAQKEQSKDKSANKIEASVFVGKQFIRLPDGSTVLLNANSELSYSDSFGSGTREVSLKGEGFFDIAHDATKPFLVKANGITTTVLGTAFNVRAYPGDKEVKVTVKRGKVKVGDDTKTFGLITPDQQIAVEIQTHEFVQTNLTKAIAEKETAWMNSALVLDDVNLETAAALIAQRYNTKVIFVNSALKSCRFRGAFLNGESLESVLEVIGEVLHLEYSIEADGNVKLDGKGC